MQLKQPEKLTHHCCHLLHHGHTQMLIELVGLELVTEMFDYLPQVVSLQFIHPTTLIYIVPILLQVSRAEQTSGLMVK